MLNKTVGAALAIIVPGGLIVLGLYVLYKKMTESDDKVDKEENPS